jgi:hypothetical protein
MKEITIKVLKNIVPLEYINQMLEIKEYVPGLIYDAVNKKSIADNHKTSYTFYNSEEKFEEIKQLIIKAIEKETGDSYNSNQCEQLQLQRYDIGQYFKPHFDFFNHGEPQYFTSNDRIATAILYLKSAEKGGTTNFPALGIKIKCNPGDVVYFTYKENEKKENSLHEGAAIEQGQKIIATMWIRGKSLK